MNVHLYAIQRGSQKFIGVASSIEHAREAWGAKAEIEEIESENELIEIRAAMDWLDAVQLAF